jgi:hypothetical protein
VIRIERQNPIFDGIIESQRAQDRAALDGGPASAAWRSRATPQHECHANRKSQSKTLTYHFHCAARLQDHD